MAIRKAKRRLIIEFDCSNNNTIKIENYERSKNHILELLLTFENEKMRHLHYFVTTNMDLLSFLSLGSVEIFNSSFFEQPISIFANSEFVDFITPFFIPQFNVNELFYLSTRCLAL